MNKKLKLKSGLKQVNEIIGNLVFDSDKIKERHYQYYYDNGFAKYFEWICEECNEEPCICNNESEEFQGKEIKIKKINTKK